MKGTELVAGSSWLMADHGYGQRPGKNSHVYALMHQGKWKGDQVPPLWDGKVSQRIVDIVEQRGFAIFITTS